MRTAREKYPFVTKVVILKKREHLVPELLMYSAI